VNRDGESEGTLVVFKAIPSHPGRPPGKLHGVQQYEQIGMYNPVEEARVGAKVGLVHGDDHWIRPGIP